MSVNSMDSVVCPYCKEAFDTSTFEIEDYYECSNCNKSFKLSIYPIFCTFTKEEYKKISKF